MAVSRQLGKLLSHPLEVEKKKSLAHKRLICCRHLLNMSQMEDTVLLRSLIFDNAGCSYTIHEINEEVTDALYLFFMKRIQSIIPSMD